MKKSKGKTRDQTPLRGECDLVEILGEEFPEIEPPDLVELLERLSTNSMNQLGTVKLDDGQYRALWHLGVPRLQAQLTLRGMFDAGRGRWS